MRITTRKIAHPPVAVPIPGLSCSGVNIHVRHADHMDRARLYVCHMHVRARFVFAVCKCMYVCCIRLFVLLVRRRRGRHGRAAAAERDAVRKHEAGERHPGRNPGRPML